MITRKFFGDADISNVENIDALLEQISRKENEIQVNLDDRLGKQCQIESRLLGINKATLVLVDVCKDSKNLDSQINQTAELAESVSAKVRRLDLARSWVSDCQQRVHDLIDLQLCSHGVMNAIIEEDFEIGAGHINRFLAMDLQLLKKTADEVQGSISAVSEAINKLERATVEMRDLIVRKFNEAVQKEDLASAERFFKIFPLLGRHQEGIEKFFNYICMTLSTKAEKEIRNSIEVAKAEQRLPLAYSDTLTSLLGNFARVIEVYQPIVETYYGFDYLLDMVKVLQSQCDKEVKHCLLEFNKNRKISYRVQQINESFSRSSTNNNSTSTVTLGHYRSSSGDTIDKLNPKDIDAVITEITVMHYISELYFRFLKRRVMTDKKETSSNRKLPQDRLDKMDQLLTQSDLSRQMQELLGTYLLFERYFMEESVIKAIAMDTYENGQLCSSMVDDVFFILRKSIRRSLSTQSVNGTCAVINNAASCLDNNFVNALRAPLKQGYSSGYIDLAQAYSALQSTLQQGRIQAGDSEESRLNFLVQLNNADMSTEYIETLLQTMEQEIMGAFPAITKVEKEIVGSCLAELKTVRDTLKACVDFGIQQLRSSAIKPRLQPWVDQFLQYKHYFTEEELATYNAGETFVQFLIVQIDGLLNRFKQNLTPRNTDALISIVATELASHLEKAIKKCTFNRLGGLVLDQEVRTLGAYLASATSWSIRDKMTRLTQIATILNLEKISELNDYWNPENGMELSSWRITPTEARAILTLRVDFRMEDIKRIKFQKGI